jgi:D-alanine-D-alanine ligase
MKKKVIIACGGPSSEHDVSIMSTNSILEHIDREKYDISLLYITRDKKVALLPAGKSFNLPEHITYISFEDGVKKYLKGVDLVFLGALHGEFGEDGQMQSILEKNNIKYTGSTSKVSELVMNKEKTIEKVKVIPNILFPETTIVYPETQLPRLTFPLFCKPNNLGSSVGAKVIHTKEELDTHLQGLWKSYPDMEVLLQEYIKGLEISIGCLEKTDGEFIKLPPIEIIPTHSEYFDYDSKYIAGESLEITPPEHISKELAETISRFAMVVHKLLGCTVYSRTDIMVKDDEIYFLETNTLPGMTANSLLPKEAAAIGMDFTALLDFLISNSL